MTVCRIEKKSKNFKVAKLTLIQRNFKTAQQKSQYNTDFYRQSHLLFMEY